MNVPYYLQPTPDQASDIVFNIPISISPPGVVYTEDQVSSLWTRGLEGAGEIIGQVSDFTTEAVSSTIDTLKRGKDSVVGAVLTPFEYVQSAFNYTMWLTIAGVLTLVYLVVK